MAVDYSRKDLQGRRFIGVYLFTFVLLASLLSGYIAMLAGTTVQKMVRSVGWRLEVSGYILFAFFLLFTGAALWKGLSIAITRVLVAPIVITFLLGMVMYLTGAGTAIGAFLVVFVVTLMASMFSNGNDSRGRPRPPWVSSLLSGEVDKCTNARWLFTWKVTIKPEAK